MPAPSARVEVHDRRPAGVRHHEHPSDFLDFLHKLLDVVFAPLVLKLVLALLLVAASTAFSFLAVAAFWYAWSTGGAVEVEGWLTYGSRTHPTPHALIALPPAKFQQDLAYDVGVEMELVRPTKAEETGNFMLTLELRAARVPGMIMARAAQPSLAPPPLSASYLSLPSLRLPSPPCLIPWPFRPLCPARLLGRAPRRRKAVASTKAVVPLRKELVEGVVVRPSAGESAGTAFVSVGREDAFSDAADAAGKARAEIRTTGWVVVTFTPHATGVRWLLTSSLLPPLIILPPLAIGLSLSSSLFAFVLINYFLLPKSGSKPRARVGAADTGKDARAEQASAHDGLRRRLGEKAPAAPGRQGERDGGGDRDTNGGADGDARGDPSDATSESGTAATATETASVASSDAWD